MDRKERNNHIKASMDLSDARGEIYCMNCKHFDRPAPKPIYWPCSIDGTLRYFIDGAHCQSFKFAEGAK